MANLNGDVLRLIFDYLEAPHDWVQVSQVCKLWKTAASKQWRTASNLKIDDEENFKKAKNVKVVSFVDAKRMVYCVAPFVQVLSGSTKSVRLEDLFISFGSFYYRTRGRAVVLLELLAQNASKIKEVRFKRLPEPKLLHRLINNNNITKVTAAESDAFYKHVPTEKIEELNIIFQRVKYVKSFAGVFPNLKNLDLELDFHIERSYSRVMKEKFPLVLPYVLGLTSLQLHISTYCSVDLIDICSDTSKLSQLENLSLVFSKVCDIKSVDLFFIALSKGCPKLRAVKLANLKIYERDLCVLFNLPNLEILDVSVVHELRTLELLKPTKLSQLRIQYEDNENLSVTTLANALKMMPKLKVFQIEKIRGIWFGNRISDLSVRNSELIFEIINVVVSQGKDVVMKDPGNKFPKELRIANKNIPLYLEVETMTILTPLNETENFLERVKELAEKKLKRHYAVIEEYTSERNFVSFFSG